MVVIKVCEKCGSINFYPEAIDAKIIRATEDGEFYVECLRCGNDLLLADKESTYFKTKG